MIKRYDTAQTPYQRVLAHLDIDQAVKDQLSTLYGTLNPAQLRRDIAAKQDQLIALSAAKGHPDQAEPAVPTRASESDPNRRVSR